MSVSNILEIHRLKNLKNDLVNDYFYFMSNIHDEEEIASILDEIEVEIESIEAKIAALESEK